MHLNIIEEKRLASPENGKNLLLWLDSDLEKKLADSLGKAIKRVGAKAGAAIALNPQTGGVLALVSLPSFDNNLFSQGKDASCIQAGYGPNC